MNRDVANINSTPRQTLSEFIAANRNKCLDSYVTNLRTLGGTFIYEDYLITRVRGGTFLDALVESLRGGRTDFLNEYFRSASQQLLAVGYNFEQIKTMYDTLEKSILDLLPPAMNQEPGFAMSLRTLKSAIQLARMVAVNQYVSQVNQFSHNPSSGVAGRPNSQSKSRSAPELPLPNLSTRQVSQASRAELKTTVSWDGPSRNGQAQNNSSKGLAGFLEWPLQAIPGTKPSEYAASLEDGKIVQVLLVDHPQAYAAKGIIHDKLVECRVKQIGPVSLAYPL